MMRDMHIIMFCLSENMWAFDPTDLGTRVQVKYKLVNGKGSDNF